jgi:hypothetical protein
MGLRKNGDYLPMNLVFLLEMQCAYCEIGTEFLNIILIIFMLQRHYL